MIPTLLTMNANGYLKEIGWINSSNKQMPLDEHNNPLPWVTYPFIDFIEERLTNKLEVFEFGSGNSTLWYAGKVRFVTSVEHDDAWYKKIKSTMPNNVALHYQQLEYAKEYAAFAASQHKRFHIIIVDGRDRVNCIMNAVNSLTEDGVIVLDDSERVPYQEGIDFLIMKGFKKIDFWGISPGFFYKKCTTVFYRPDNCLGI